MKTAFLCLAALLIAFNALAVTIHLRNGESVTGDIVEKNDQTVTIRTDDGNHTYHWPQLYNRSIKDVHPDLYNRLKQEAIERRKEKEAQMRAKGMVKHEGEWIAREELIRKKLRHVSLKVRSTESGGSFDKVSSTDSTKRYVQDCNGILEIELSGLDPDADHTVTTVYTHFLRYEGDYKGKDNPTIDKNITKEETVSGQRSFTTKYITSTYQRHKTRLKPGWHYEGGGKGQMWGVTSDSWDIKIYLDGALIYEEHPGKSPTYHIVSKSW